MCEPLLPIDELKNLRWSVRSLIHLHQVGSFEREIANNATRGIESRLDWIMRQLDGAGEGKKNMGL
jgi:hypothetical protein